MPRSSRSIALMSLVVTGLAVAICAPHAPAAADATADAFAKQARCFSELAQGKARDIVCEYPAILTEQERTDLRKLTREYLQDAQCMVSIRVERARVAQALVAPDLVFDVPPQPVKCELKTKDSVIPITGTFAPRVTIKGGEAVNATPGLANVQGVSSYLAWPVVQYVNRAPSIRTEMVRMINQYRARVAAKIQNG